jgi:hypothetical protein
MRMTENEKQERGSNTNRGRGREREREDKHEKGDNNGIMGLFVTPSIIDTT